ncbi:MAG: phenylalanine--tRNA ligase subunit beta [candidate division WS1 bacterium]|nr:phenylalanine--tRNA ligase subunit beta [candidate division WS1 bacterium]
MRVPYSWLMEYLDTKISAEELAEVLTMGGLEVESVEQWRSADGEASDEVLMTSVTSNRGDLLSMVGVARHAAALLKCDLKLPDYTIPATESPNVGERDLEQGDTRITIEDLDGCPRYSALRVVGVEVRESPQWMRHRLEAAGIRPISNVVDATNYVLWELGQPLHAFDHRLVVKGQIIVRRAKPGEKLITIDENTRELTDRDLVIADPKGAIALAGVMGGVESEMRERTTDVLIESAHFNPSMIRRTAQRHTMSTEASYRFERHVDPNLTLPALARAARLIEQIAGGQIVGNAIDVHKEQFAREPIVLRPARTNHVLGTALDTDTQVDLLGRLGFEVLCEQVEMQTPERDWLRPHPDEQQALDRLTVTVPTRRPDIEREIDLIEEIAIVFGYNNIPATLPPNTSGAGMRTREQKLQERVSEVMRGAGLCENVSYSMMGGCDLDFLCIGTDADERQALCLRDPAAENQELMRTTLLPGLLAAARYNVRQRVEDIALFEIGRVFTDIGAALPDEREKLAAVCMGSARTSTWNMPDEYEKMDFFWLKGVLEQLLRRLHISDVKFERSQHASLHHGRSAKILVKGEHVGDIGEAQPKVQSSYDLPEPTCVLEIDLKKLLRHARLLTEYKPQPRLPAAVRDLALVVDDDAKHTGGALVTAAEKSAGELLEDVTIFDIYKDPHRLGEGRKSVAMRLRFRHPERTLTDAEVDEAMGRVIKHMESKLGAEARTW